jgi:catechol 2,3-dioxygenase-like lactoylglutathione lyase family enzyme
MEETSALTEGIHHLGLTVRNAKATADFFVRVFGFRLVAEELDYPAYFVSDGTVLLTLWQVQKSDPAPFDRRSQLGLHHFALRLRAEKTLDEVHEALKLEADVEIEFAPEALGAGPTRHLMCSMPGGPRMEIIAPAA